MGDESRKSPDQVRERYEAWWSRVRTASKRQIDAGETSLCRILHRTYADTVGERASGEDFSVLWGMEVPVPYLAANRIVRDWIADTVIAAASNTDAVIEMGSGWGYNLFNIWLRGGPDVPYHAFEYTEAGRAVARSVRDASAGGPRIEVHPFDYYDADFAPIAGRYGRVVVFSSHSIEQIESLPAVALEAVLGVAEEVLCLHFEPIGWQFADETRQAIRDYGQRAYGEKHGYNKNLWPLLKDYQQRGRLTIEHTSADAMCVKTYNGTSLIRWRSNPR
ncbi:MAG: hypothetical protein RBS99_09630 [Rhodospirillales bacterium]|nr:hypothetical protein [Rhodospirillales bacterium]